MNKRDTFDKILDALIDEAIPIVESMPDEDLPDERPVEFSEDFERRMEQTFKNAKKKIRRKKLYKYTRRIAACFAVLIVASGITVMSVSALRVKLFNLIFNTQETNTEIHFENEDQENMYSDTGLELSYVPNGFVIDKKEIKEDRVYLKYRNDNQYFSITVSESSGTLSIDTEDAITEEMYINGNKALYSENTKLKTLTYIYNNYVYVIKGDIEKTEIIKIAENLKKI